MGFHQIFVVGYLKQLHHPTEHPNLWPPSSPLPTPPPAPRRCCWAFWCDDYAPSCHHRSWQSIHPTRPKGQSRNLAWVTARSAEELDLSIGEGNKNTPKTRKWSVLKLKTQLKGNSGFEKKNWFQYRNSKNTLPYWFKQTASGSWDQSPATFFVEIYGWSSTSVRKHFFARNLLESKRGKLLNPPSSASHMLRIMPNHAHMHRMHGIFTYDFNINLSQMYR